MLIYLLKYRIITIISIMSYITAPKYKQVEFIVNLHLLTLIKKREQGIIFHILAYKENEKMNKIDAVCLELGTFIEAENKEEVINKFKDIIVDVFNFYTKGEILKLLKNSHMDKFWTLYREHAYKTATQTIKKELEQKKKENEELINNKRKTADITNDSLSENVSAQHTPGFDKFLIDNTIPKYPTIYKSVV